MTQLAHPLHYLIVKREGTTWYFKPGSTIFHNPKNVPVSLQLEDRLHRFGLSVSTAMIEMFRLDGGKPGYYLVNLRDKAYYYCGSSWDDVKAVFLSLGIGKEDPLQR